MLFEHLFDGMHWIQYIIFIYFCLNKILDEFQIFGLIKNQEKTKNYNGHPTLVQKVLDLPILKKKHCPRCPGKYFSFIVWNHTLNSGWSHQEGYSGTSVMCPHMFCTSIQTRWNELWAIYRLDPLLFFPFLRFSFFRHDQFQPLFDIQGI